MEDPPGNTPPPPVDDLGHAPPPIKPRLMPMYEPPPQVALRDAPFKFTGVAGEYFRIWIVNVLLTMVTLGLYSAWAKVRKRQYLYRNTWVDDANFDYLADPRAILKGRVIIGLALGMFYASQYYAPMMSLVLILLYAMAMPWVLVKSMAFNARNTAYRNIRFAFDGQLGEAYGLYLLLPALTGITVGLLYPYVHWSQQEFVVNKHRLGQASFRYHATAKQMYMVYLPVVGLFILSYAIFIALLVALIPFGESPAELTPEAVPDAASLLPLLMVPLFMIPALYLKVRLTNLMYNNMTLQGHSFRSTLRTWPLVGIHLGNTIMVVLSLGLLSPWAKVRVANYHASCLTMRVAGDGLQVMADRWSQAPGAYGDAAADFGDFDLGL